MNKWVWGIALFCVAAFLSTEVSAAEGRPEHSGIYALWYGKQDSPLLDVPYLAGGQVVKQWREIEPEEGKYNFLPLEADLKALSERGMATTIQVNGNQKPKWLFDKVPYHPEKLHKQVSDPQGTMMYWHENHVKAYTDFIRALAQFVKASPYRSALLGVRLNYNAIGTELTRVPPENVPLDQWKVPDGVEQGPAWTPEIAAKYQDTIVQTYIDAYVPDVMVFVRSTVNDETRERFEQLFRTGKLGWFHTSARAQQVNETETFYRNQIYIDYCRSGQTLGYTENSNETWNKKVVANPVQWNYWRCLNALHTGVSFIGVYAMDLEVAHDGTQKGEDFKQYQDEFRKAYEFTAPYAGWHVAPEGSPGAWIAFRDSDLLPGDYTFLMERKPDQTKAVTNAGPEDSRFGMWARVLEPGDTMEISVDPKFSASLADLSSTLHLTYLDQGNGSILVSTGGKEMTAQCEDSGEWRQTSMELNGSVRQISIRAEGAPATLHMVEITRD